MDREEFVQNVKMLCLRQDVRPTNACRDSGAGPSFLSDVKRGKVPSVEKVQLLAAYLGVTTSELLGEEATGPGGAVSDSDATGSDTALEARISREHGDEARSAFTMYLRLDAGDRGEIRGEMRQMLRAPKYSSQESLKNA